MDNFIIIKSEEDYPKDIYKNTHHIYLCILQSGKTVVCKYTEYGFENASYCRDALGTVVAYKRITFDENILNLCTGSGVAKQKVEYFDGLK